VARDLDVLQIERRLMATSGGKRRNILPSRYGRLGRQHAQAPDEWWQTTGFVEQVFYFGYDERAGVQRRSWTFSTGASE